MSKGEEQQPASPLYIQVAQRIQQDIRQKNLPPHSKLPSELELTRQYGTSHNTINKAIGLLVQQGLLYRLRPQGTFVAAETAQEADPAPAPANRTEYTPAAPSHIGLIVPYLADGFLSNIVLGVAMEVQAAGFRLDFAYSENDWAMERYQINQFVQQGVAGIIILPGDHAVEVRDGRFHSLQGTERIEMLRQLQAQEVPFVLLDRYVPEVECNYVVSDDFAAGYAATQHLISLGHRRIGFIASSKAQLMTSGLNRELGYQRALADYGIPVEESLFLEKIHQSQPLAMPGQISIQDFAPGDQVVLCEYLQRKDRPSAIVVTNDYVALHVLQAAQYLELSIPDDLALVCSGGGGLSAFMRVPLTSVLQPVIELGRQGVHTLLNLMARRVSSVQHIALPVSLSVRKSCGAAERSVPLVFPSSQEIRS